MTIECMVYRGYVKGSLQGFANLWIPKMGIELHGCSIHMKDGRRWLNLPSREYPDSTTGEMKYVSIVRFRNKEHQNLFCEKAKGAVDEWIAKNAPPPGAQPEEAQFQEDPEIPF